MNAYNAVGILDGFVEPEDMYDVARAACWIRDHGPRGVLAGNGTQRALAIAAMVEEFGIDAAVCTLEGNE